MTRMKSLFLSLFVSVFALTASAMPNIPVPISEDYPLRLGAALKTGAGFSPFAFQELTGIVGVGYGFGGGFEGGFQFRSGGNSQRIFTEGYATTTELGGDLFLRYLGTVADVFYLGLQGRFGYDYTFGQPSITNASSVTASVGIPFGFILSPIIYVYAMPEVDFGRRAALSEGAFGSLVGFGASVGVFICLGSPKIFFEVKPKTVNISNIPITTGAPDGFVLEATLGMAFEI